MKIGNLEVDNNIFLAPMAEVTDYAFRTIAKKYGAGLTFTQMVSADGVIKNNFKTLKMLTFSRNEKPVGVQLLGKDPDIIGKAIRELVKFKPTVIDLNCGCPVEKVYKNQMGAYLLSQPRKLAKLVSVMVKNSNGIPISVKLRLSPNDKVNVLENAKIIENNGASIIIVHARNKIDRYAEKAKWEWIGKVKDELNIPVIGNGSVFTAEDGVEMLNQTNCDGVVVARGALGNPFIFKQIELLKKGEQFTPTIEDITNVATEHVTILEKEQDFIISLDRAKKNIIWYFKYQNGIENLIDDLYVAKSFEKLKEIINKHSNKLLDGKYPQVDINEIKKKFNNRVLFWLAKEE